jgi:hypothetical protein
MTDETPQQPAMTGEGNQPEGTGYAPPDTGLGDDAESEIPVGVDSIEAKDPPADDAEGGAAAIDVSNLDVGGEADADADASGDADAEGDADADAEGESSDET